MASSPVKISILTLSADAVNCPELAGWRYLSTGTRFVLQPCNGVKVSIGVGWTFKGWFAYSQPWITVESKLLINTFASVLGRRPQVPAVRYRYQQLWQRTGRAGYRPEFWEDIIDKNHDGERLVDDVPHYIVELVEDYNKHVAPDLDFEDEIALLRTLPATYQYHGYPMQDALLYLLTRCILGDLEAAAAFIADPPMPAAMLNKIAADIEQIRIAAPTLAVQ